MKPLLPLLLLLIFVWPAHAVPAGTLAKNCQTKSDLCIGYLAGMLDTANGSSGEINGIRYSLAYKEGGITPDMARLAFIAYMKAHPEKQNAVAAVVVGEALVESGLAYIKQK